MDCPPLLHSSQGPVHLPGWGCPPGTPGSVKQEEQECLQDSVPKTHQLYKHWGRHMTSHCNFMMACGGLPGVFPKCLPMGLSYRVHPFLMAGHGHMSHLPEKEKLVLGGPDQPRRQSWGVEVKHRRGDLRPHWALLDGCPAGGVPTHPHSASPRPPLHSILAGTPTPNPWSPH